MFEELFEELKHPSTIGLVWIQSKTKKAKQNMRVYVLQVAALLREHGEKVSTNLVEDRKLGKQIKHFSNMGFGTVIIIGKKEKRKKSVTIRDLISGEQKEFRLKKLVRILGG